MKHAGGRPPIPAEQKLHQRSMRLTESEWQHADQNGGIRYIRTLVRSDMDGTSTATAPAQLAAPILDHVELDGVQDGPLELMTAAQINERLDALESLVNSMPRPCLHGTQSRNEFVIDAILGSIDGALPDIGKIMKAAAVKKNTPEQKALYLHSAQATVVSAEITIGALMRELAHLRAAHEKHTGIQWTVDPQD